MFIDSLWFKSVAAAVSWCPFAKFNSSLPLSLVLHKPNCYTITFQLSYRSLPSFICIRCQFYGYDTSFIGMHSGIELMVFLVFLLTRDPTSWMFF